MDAALGRSDRWAPLRNKLVVFWLVAPGRAAADSLWCAFNSERDPVPVMFPGRVWTSLP